VSTSSVDQLAALVGTALRPLLDPLSSTNPNGTGLKAFVGQLG
jgi:hypothetical protein